MKKFGLVAVKIGCSTHFDETSGIASCVTVLKIAKCIVSAVKKKDEKDGYDAIQLAYDKTISRPGVISKPMLGNLNKSGLPMLRFFKEFAFDATSCNINDPVVGTELDVSAFIGSRKVDVTGYVKGRGFTGGMKRHGFAGLEATHGVSVSHRSHGSTGQRTDPGKCFKNKKMAGRHGMFQKTIQGLRVMHIDQDNNIISVKGAVPGSIGSFVFVREVAKF